MGMHFRTIIGLGRSILINRVLFYTRGLCKWIRTCFSVQNLHLYDVIPQKVQNDSNLIKAFGDCHGEGTVTPISLLERDTD